LERAAVHKAAGDIVEPEALTEVVECLRWFHHVDSRLAAGMGDVNRAYARSPSRASRRYARSSHQPTRTRNHNIAQENDRLKVRHSELPLRSRRWAIRTYSQTQK
jgi:hypothetical protein